MATILTPTRTWVARNARLFMVSPASKVTFSNSATLSGSFLTAGWDLTAMCKNVTITPPETAWEKLDLLGKDSNQFQNQVLDEKAVGTATATGTMVVDSDESLWTVLSGTFASAPAGYSRYMLGSNNTSGNTIAACFTVEAPDSSKYYAVAFDSARFTKWGDVRATADGSMEQDFTILCLAKNFYVEFKN